MKNNLLRYGMLTGLLVLFALVFAFGGMFSRFMTDERADLVASEAARRETAVYLAMFETADSAVKFDSAVGTKTYALAGGRGDFSPTLEQAYRVYNGETLVGYVYIVNSFGKFTGLKVAYAIEAATDSCVAVSVLSNAETPNYFSTLTSTFYDQFSEKAFDVVALEVEAVSGATYSSKGIEIGLLYAREAYDADTEFAIPTVSLSLLDIEYNFDPATFVARPFIAHITHGPENTAASVYLSLSFDYVAMVGGGTALEADEQAALKIAAGASPLVSNRAYFASYDAGTRTVVMKAKGYNVANHIQVTLVLKADLTGVESFTVLSSESYDSLGEYGEYTGNPVPAVENLLLNMYKTTSSTILTPDAVVGASEATFPAIQALVNLLDAFITDLNGGI